MYDKSAPRSAAPVNSAAPRESVLVPNHLLARLQPLAAASHGATSERLIEKWIAERISGRHPELQFLLHAARLSSTK